MRTISFLPIVGIAFVLSPLVRADDSAAPTLPPIAATVNGETISSQEWLTRLQALNINEFSQSPRTRVMRAGQLALEQLINERIIMQYSAKVGLVPSEAEVAQEVAAQKATPAVKERLDNGQLTEAQLAKSIRYQKTLQAFVTINQNVSPDEIRAYYDQNYGRKWQIGMIRTSKRDTAQQAYAALQKGDPFEQVAAKYSEDPATKAAGGAFLGPDGKPRWFTTRDQSIPPQVLAAVEALKNAGDYTQVVEGQTSGGGGQAFFIFRLLGRFKPADEDFLKMRPQVEKEALMAKALRSGAAELKLNAARKEAKVAINLPGYQYVP